MVVDLKELKEILEREVMERMDHRFLNYEVVELKGKIPTCENIARVIWELLDPKIKQGRLHRVRLYESADLFWGCQRNGAAGGLVKKQRTTRNNFAQFAGLVTRPHPGRRLSA